MSDQPELKKLLSSLGLCVKAGKTVFGVPMICEAMRKGGRGMPKLVIEAADTSENTHKKINDKCAYYKVRCERIGADGETLAKALGKTGVIAAVAVTDERLCEVVIKNI